MRLPAPLVDRAARTHRGLEVGAGRDFSTSLALAASAPEAEWLVSDVDERVLAAPPPLRALLLDVTRVAAMTLPPIDLVLGVRIPEELQLPAARLARALDADLALKPLKDEWADVSLARLRTVVWPDGWRYFPAR